jgi:DNA-binding SARP family transcriptional activator
MLNAPEPPVSDQPRTDGHDRTAAESAEPAPMVEPSTERTPLALSVLGPVQLRYRRPTTGNQPTEADGPPTEEVLAVPGISRPARELLAYLAAHPGGATRDAIIEALWPNSAADRPDTAFHTTISRLRKRLRDATGTDTTGDVITTSDGRWHLNRTHVTVDYWTFLETHPRNPDPTLRRHDHHIAVQLYQGPFAADFTGEWTHTIREATRRRYLEAINDLTETEITTNPELALDLLERARNLEPLNEAIYRNIMRIHLKAHRHDDARGVYQLLRTHLATIDVTPEPETQELAATLPSRLGHH